MALHGIGNDCCCTMQGGTSLQGQQMHWKPGQSALQAWVTETTFQSRTPNDVYRALCSIPVC